MKGWLDKLENGDEVKKEEPSMMETLTNKFGSMFEGMDFTSKMKKANELIPIVKMIPGGEKFLKDQAYKIARQSGGGVRPESYVNSAINNTNIGGYTGSFGINPDRNLIKLGIYNNETGFNEVPDDILKKAIIPTRGATDDIKSYFIETGKPGNPIKQAVDSLSYESMNQLVGEVLNRNRVKKGLKKYEGEQLIQKSDSVLNSITPTNSVIYSTSKENPINPPYKIQDNLAGYSARIRKDPDTNSLWYDINDVWDFDSGYGERWGGNSSEKDMANEQAKALNSVFNPFRLVATNPIAKPKKKYEDGGKIENIVNGVPFTQQKATKLDSLANQLRNLQHLQTLQFQEAYPDVPINDILSLEQNDKRFRNRNLDQKADSLISLYGDKNIPINEAYKNLTREYSNLISEAGQVQPVVGNKEQGLQNFGYRAMLYKYLHPDTIPAYKTLETNYNKQK